MVSAVVHMCFECKSICWTHVWAVIEYRLIRYRYGNRVLVVAKVSNLTVPGASIESRLHTTTGSSCSHQSSIAPSRTCGGLSSAVERSTVVCGLYSHNLLYAKPLSSKNFPRALCKNCFSPRL